MEAITENKVVPKLRFGGNENGYFKYDFSEIAEKSSKTHNPNKDSTNFKCIELECLSQRTGMLLNVFDSVDLKSNKTKFKKGDVLFGKLRPYLKKYLLTSFDGVCTSEIWVLNGVKVSNPYLFQLVQTPKFVFEANMTSGSKMPRADWEYVKSIKYSIPTLPEQQKISTFLSSVDAKLQQLSKKKSLLADYKKGVMQKIFSQELRFKPALSEVEGDANGNNYPEWEEKKLGEVFNALKGKGLSKDKLDDNGQLKCILYGELYTTYNEQITVVKKRTNSDEGVSSRFGDLLVPCSTTTTGIDLANVTALNEENVKLGGDISILRGKKEINNVFYAYYLSNYKKLDIARYGQGTTIVHLYFNHFKAMRIDIPPLEEQQKIANFLTALDAKTEKVNTQIKNTQAFKKGLLQQMFV